MPGRCCCATRLAARHPPLQDRADLPEIIRAGRHLGAAQALHPRARRRTRGRLRSSPTRSRSRRAAGDGWVKLVGDWIDREVGDLAPLWPDDVLVAAIDAAHADGARVTAHVFGDGRATGLISAGIDCIEHGTGLTEDLDRRDGPRTAPRWCPR